MLAIIYRETGDKVVMTKLTDDKSTHDLSLPDDLPGNKEEMWKWLSSLPLNTGLIVDVELNNGKVSNLINLKQFMIQDAAITVEERAKDPSFVDTVAGVAEDVLQEIMNEPRILH